MSPDGAIKLMECNWVGELCVYRNRRCTKPSWSNLLMALSYVYGKKMEDRQREGRRRDRRWAVPLQDPPKMLIFTECRGLGLCLHAPLFNLATSPAARLDDSHCFVHIVCYLGANQKKLY